MVQLIADSLDAKGNRITSAELILPKYLLAELNKHRMFTNSAASSRAIPFFKMLASVQEEPFIPMAWEEEPFVPMAWQKAHKGMQGYKYFDDTSELNKLHLELRDLICQKANELHLKGISKQITNRYLEPFMFAKVLVTATEFSNFFEQRCSNYEVEGKRIYSMNEFAKISSISDINELLKVNKGTAEIHLMRVADALYDAIKASTPVFLKEGEWHVPYYNESFNQDQEYVLENTFLGKLELPSFLCSAVAQCARTSYSTLGKGNIYEDAELFDFLEKEMHLTPFEHCARVMTNQEYAFFRKEDQEGWCANFRGFYSLRRMLERFKSK